MRLDVVFRDVRLVDGTGAPPRQTSVGVRDGRIAILDAGSAPARLVVEGGGALLTPGFIDLHTHYDGQATWDADLAPASLHGVTTVVMGNCGVGFAPCRVTDRERLIALMEGVEDIPGSALAEGLPWTWTDFPSYLDALETMPRTLDVMAQVPHDALRVWVMGERAAASEVATEADIEAMSAILRSALVAGAAGFSTGRTDNHRSNTGEPTPASEATLEELVGLAGAFRGLGHGVLQAVSDFDLARGPAEFDREFDAIERLVAAADGHPLLLSLVDRDGAPGHAAAVLTRLEMAAEKGLAVRAVVAPRAIGVVLGLRASFHPFMGFPTWQSMAALSHRERVLRVLDPQVRTQLLSETSLPIAGATSPVPALADRLLARLDLLAFRLFRLTDPPDYEPSVQQSLGAEARRKGIGALEMLLDALLEEGGERLLYFPIFNYASGDLDPVRTWLQHPLTLPGLADGGAHVGTICDASFPTFLLAHQVRDRGALTLQDAVYRLSGAVADVYGLTDRGRVVVGARADLNLIDLAGLSLELPRLVSDLPAGGQRLLQGAKGVVGTWVAGTQVVAHGVLTGAKPGKLVRMGL